MDELGISYRAVFDYAIKQSYITGTISNMNMSWFLPIMV